MVQLSIAPLDEWTNVQEWVGLSSQANNSGLDVLMDAAIGTWCDIAIWLSLGPS